MPISSRRTRGTRGTVSVGPGFPWRRWRRGTHVTLCAWPLEGSEALFLLYLIIHARPLVGLNIIPPPFRSCPHELTSMSTRSTRYRHARGDRINRIGLLTMVACSYCVKMGLPCRMSSLSSRCGNCYREGIQSCLPAHIPLPDFSKIDKELSKLEAQEDSVEAELVADEKLAETLSRRMRASRAKLQRLRNQKKLLKRKEQVVFDEGRVDAEELERLEELEHFNAEVASVNAEAPAEAAVVDWSSLWDVPESSSA